MTAPAKGEMGVPGFDGACFLGEARAADSDGDGDGDEAPLTDLAVGVLTTDLTPEWGTCSGESRGCLSGSSGPE